MLLVQEVLGKISDIIEKKNIFIVRWFLRAVFYLVLIFLFTLLLYGIFTGNQIYVIIALGLYFLAEIAHFIRKSRERALARKAKTT